MVFPGGVGRVGLRPRSTDWNAPLALNCFQASFQSSQAGSTVTSPAKAASANVPKPQAVGEMPSGGV